MAAYYNRARNGKGFSGIAFGCSMEWETLKALWVCSERQACGRRASFAGGAARAGTSLAQAGSPLPSQGAGCILEDKPSALKNQKEKAEFVPAGFGCWVGFFTPPLVTNHAPKWGGSESAGLKLPCDLNDLKF